MTAAIELSGTSVQLLMRDWEIVKFPAAERMPALAWLLPQVLMTEWLISRWSELRMR
jgi:hypothetical protein